MRTLSIALAAILLAACDRAKAPDGRSTTDSVPPSVNQSAGVDTAIAPPRMSTPVSDTGLTVVVRRVQPGVYTLAGRTRSAEVLQLSVEDGHNVLYGPTEVTVAGGAFTAEARLEPTEARTVFAYLADLEGTRQWVVPIPLDSAAVHWSGGGEAALPAPGTD
ncbi:MAG TPA: hypothetical protein VF665_12315 [Longimicrobium sp.]|jgi:hypothetical protein|uniref:hypothetical protein n=1 Tax=Longimicrobium sp. TaxID=2029185 RepID=UPI002EDAA660